MTRLQDQNETPIDPSVATSPTAKYEPDEMVVGLECSYGTFAYSYAPAGVNNASGLSQRPGCHNPVEKPQERYHCAVCGGDYCSIHEAQADHDCENIMLPERRVPAANLPS